MSVPPPVATVFGRSSNTSVASLRFASILYVLRRTVLAWLLLATFLLTSRTATADTPLILVSLDGFRWDYCEKYPDESPTLRTLKHEGVSSRGLIPAFPSNTFPNHYTIVTGLYPAKHGIVNNDFSDPASGLIFRYNNPTVARDPRWWDGEPIWATAIKQGRKAATSFWVGSDVEVRGMRPTFWRNYDYSIPFERRLEELAGWLTAEPAARPDIVTFYLEETNSAGHAHGPDSPQVAAAIKLSDARIAALLARLRREGIEPNLLIVSDHGMTATSVDRTVMLENYIDPTKVQVDADGSSAALRPIDGDIDALMRAVEKIPHAKTYRAADLPPRLRFADNPRIAPVWVLADEGWHVVTRATFDRLRKRYATRGYLAGDHGYDPAFRSMQGILIAHGPAFRRGVEIDAIENVHLYNLMCAVLKLKPATNDGDDRLVRAALAK